jgi:hypothetical protein
MAKFFAGLVHVDPATPRINYFHILLLPPMRAVEGAQGEKSLPFVLRVATGDSL